MAHTWSLATPPSPCSAFLHFSALELLACLRSTKFPFASFTWCTLCLDYLPQLCSAWTPPPSLPLVNISLALPRGIDALSWVSSLSSLHASVTAAAAAVILPDCNLKVDVVSYFFSQDEEGREREREEKKPAVFLLISSAFTSCLSFGGR